MLDEKAGAFSLQRGSKAPALGLIVVEGSGVYAEFLLSCATHNRLRRFFRIKYISIYHTSE